MSDMPFVSIVIPMRNEEHRIEACLDSILANDYPPGQLEIIVVDGRSEDSSREVVERKARKYPQIRLVANPQQVTPKAMNIGICASRGDVIFMINAHARVSQDFLAKSIQALEEHPEADATGGILISVQQTEMGEAIALAVNSPLGAGGRRYRTRRTPGLIYDTVPYAAYRRRVFDEIGLIDEELIRNQDAEFNYRLLQKGGQIYFNPEIISYLHSRSSLQQLARQQYLTGYWKVRLFQKIFLGKTNWRQLIPALFVGLTLLLGVAGLFSKWCRRLLSAVLGTYSLAVLASSIRIKLSTSSDGSVKLIHLPMAFVTLHISYGLGTLVGLWKFVVMRRRQESPHGSDSVDSTG